VRRFSRKASGSNGNSSGSRSGSAAVDVGVHAHRTPIVVHISYVRLSWAMTAAGTPTCSASIAPWKRVPTTKSKRLRKSIQAGASKNAYA
jgi:hypothetical protein